VCETSCADDIIAAGEICDDVPGVVVSPWARGGVAGGSCRIGIPANNGRFHWAGVLLAMLLLRRVRAGRRARLERDRKEKQSERTGQRLSHG
jgi:hypothetical protein